METLCKRTFCLWKPGQPMKGMYCHYVYNGKIPNTGEQRCIFCGQRKEESED